MRVLVACERSGIVREAFRARGHIAYSCDVAASEDNSPYHIRDDVLNGDIKRFHVPPGKFDGVIGGPPYKAFSKRDYQDAQSNIQDAILALSQNNPPNESPVKY